MICAKLETRNFTFVAYGPSHDVALEALKAGWNDGHRRQYKVASTFEEFVNDHEIQYQCIESGACYRDGEKLPGFPKVVITVENDAEAQQIIDVLAIAEEAGDLLFPFNVRKTS